MPYANLFGKDLITVKDWTFEELESVFELAKMLKINRSQGEMPEYLDKKTFHMLFYHTSTRTRNSFEAAVTELGGHAHYLRPTELQLHVGESVKDTAGVLGRYGQGIGVRVYTTDLEGEPYGAGDRTIREYAQWADVPVINMCTDSYHPCQHMADLMTIREKVHRYVGKKFVFSWAYNPRVRRPCNGSDITWLMPRYGIDYVLAHPKGYELDPEVIELAKKYAAESGSSFEISYDMKEAMEGAHFVYALDWVSVKLYRDYGKNGFAQDKEIRDKHKDWIVNQEMIDRCDKNVLYLHPLPAARGTEVTDEVIDGPHSVILDEAENRLHIQKAILASTMHRAI
ncbi:MAG: ornithine carbamoyltransferase [Candidatus Bathyarchaeia archaeon]|jgi:ornithine carbamoyltransferase